jgi:hypothetical protein
LPAGRATSRAWTEQAALGVEKIGVFLVQAIGIGQDRPGRAWLRHAELTTRQPQGIASGWKLLIQKSERIATKQRGRFPSRHRITLPSGKRRAARRRERNHSA